MEPVETIIGTTLAAIYLDLSQIFSSHSSTGPMHTQAISPSTCLSIASSMGLIYDYTLTFAKEIDLFWLQPRRTWSFAFFIANRYIGLLGRIPMLLEAFLPNSSGSLWCPGLLLSGTVATGILQIIGGVVMLFRVYIFYNKDRRVLSLLIAVALIFVGMCCWALLFRSSPLSGQDATAKTHAGCPDPMTSVEARHWAAAWSGQVLFDALVFTLTLRKLISARSLGRRTFTALSLRDGALFFAVMTAANVANITMYLVMTNPFERSMLAVPTNTLCVVMISRLMLNLRDLERKLTT